MCNCGYTWNEIVAIVAQFPNLETLNLSGNQINGIDESTLPGKISFIDLSNNPITSFPTNLGSLKQLNELNLMSCQIEQIKPFDKSKFGALRTLVLAENPLKTIESFDSLNLIKTLEFLSVRNCTGWFYIRKNQT